MNSNSKSHILSIFFALAILLVAVFSSHSKDQAQLTQPPRETQLTATVADAAAGAFADVEDELGQQAGGDYVDQSIAHVAAALDSEPAPSSQTEASQVVAAAFLVKDVNDAEVLGEYQADYRWPIASITKLMTAVVAVEKLGMEQEIMISQVAVETEGDAGGFTAGESFTVRDLITAMMTVSSNDAAAAIADFMGTPRFFDLMQEKAYELKMTETSFIDATGLSYLNQSTARDVAVLVQYVQSRYPEIFAVSTKSTNKITELESGLSRTLKNINTFAGTAGFVGGKTGFTEESKGNLVSLFTYEGKTYVLVVFGTDDRFAQTRKLWSFAKEKLNQRAQSSPL